MSIDTAPARRRDFLASSAFGVGAFALAHLLQRRTACSPTVPAKPGENLPLDLQAAAARTSPRRRRR